jgi:hypothetical protein
MLNTSPKLYLISLLVNGTQGIFFLSYNKDCSRPQQRLWRSGAVYVAVIP